MVQLEVLSIGTSANIVHTRLTLIDNNVHIITKNRTPSYAIVMTKSYSHGLLDILWTNQLVDGLLAHKL